MLEIEKNYKSRAIKKPVTHEEKIEMSKKTDLLLAECKDLKAKEDYQEAEKKCIEAISLDPKNKEAYYNLGEIYTALKDYEHAKEIYNFLIKLNAQDDIAYSGLGNIAAALGNFQEAKDDYIHSIILNSKTASHHLDLCETYMALGDQINALKSCQEAVKLEPKNPRNLDALLKISIQTKNKSLAVRTFDKLKKVNPENQKLDELKKEIDEM
jgi:tetratricopeptide (TPR) repeat protein